METLKTFKSMLTGAVVQLGRVVLDENRFHVIVLWDGEHYGFYNITRDEIAESLAELEKYFTNIEWQQV